jgi:hypothetical protein
MGFYFRRSKKLLPGVRVNLTAKGLGVSVGGKGIHVSQSATGKQTFSAGLPGTGLRYRKSISQSSPSSMNKVEAKSTVNKSPVAKLDRKEPANHVNDNGHVGEPNSVGEIDNDHESAMFDFNYGKFYFWATVGWISFIFLFLHLIGVLKDAGGTAIKIWELIGSIFFFIMAAAQHGWKMEAENRYFAKRNISQHAIGSEVVDDSKKEEIIETKTRETPVTSKSERSELLADLNRSRDIKGKINNPPAELYFQGMKLAKGEFGFYKCDAVFADPSHPDDKEDNGTLWITSQRIRFVSLRTTKVWDFDQVESVQSNDEDDLYIFSMKDQMKNYGFVVESDTPAFVDYFISAFTYHTPEYLGEDLNARLDRNIKEMKDKLGDY